MPSMPKVRDSSGTIGTMCLPIALSRTSVPSICTNAIVVEISRSPVALSSRSNVDSGGICERRRLAPALRQVAAERRAALVQVLHLRAVFRQA